jgi:dTDP-4-amino-4,6-dideoxygalactose transaminase
MQIFNQYEKECHLHGAGVTYSLENKLKGLFKKKYCILTNSATAGLDAVCTIMQISDKIILTPLYQWPGMLTPFLIRGNDVVLGMVNQNLSLDINSLEMCKPNVVLAVDYLGVAHNNQREWGNYCKQNGILYITDASQSLNTCWEPNCPTGAYSDIVITSFGPQKLCFAGEGGAILTDNEDVYNLLLLFITHPYRHLAEGLEINYFAHNLKMNPLGIDLANESFENIINENNLNKKMYTEFYKTLVYNRSISPKGPRYNDFNTNFSKFIVIPEKEPKGFVNMEVAEFHLVPVSDYFLPEYFTGRIIRNDSFTVPKNNYYEIVFQTNKQESVSR